MLNFVKVTLLKFQSVDFMLNYHKLCISSIVANRKVPSLMIIDATVRG